MWIDAPTGIRLRTRTGLVNSSHANKQRRTTVNNRCVIKLFSLAGTVFKSGLIPSSSPPRPKAHATHGYCWQIFSFTLQTLFVRDIVFLLTNRDSYMVQAVVFLLLAGLNPTDLNDLWRNIDQFSLLASLYQKSPPNLAYFWAWGGDWSRSNVLVLVWRWTELKPSVHRLVNSVFICQDLQLRNARKAIQLIIIALAFLSDIQV